MTTTVKRKLRRGGLGLCAGTMAALLYCAWVDLESVVFGLIAGTLIAPSIVIHALAECFPALSRVRWLGFLVPVAWVAISAAWQLVVLRSPALSQGYSDGGSEILVYLLQVYGVGLCAALAALLLYRGGGRNA